MSLKPAGRRPASHTARFYQRERTESCNPSHVRNEKWIPRAEPRPQRWRKRGSRFGCGSESRGECFAIRETVIGIARETSVDRGGERRRKTGCRAHDAGRSLRRLTDEQRGQARRLEGQTSTDREITDHAKRVNVA